MSVVVRSKALEEDHHEPPVSRRPVCELVAGPVVFTNGNENVLVNVEPGSYPLRENVDDVAVAISTIIEFNAKRVLPFLFLENVVRVRGAKNKAI